MNKGIIILIGIISICGVGISGLYYLLEDDAEKPLVYDAEADYERLIGEHEREGGVIVTKDRIVMPSKGKCTGLRLNPVPANSRITVGDTMRWNCDCSPYIDANNFCIIDLDGASSHDGPLLISPQYGHKEMTYHSAGNFSVWIGECRLSKEKSGDCNNPSWRYTTVRVSDD